MLLGSASFMRKMEVRLPGNINLKTGVFLAVDRQLAAVFAVKYNASENVDFALRMIRRSRMMPILASRDPNITPGLLHRKFYKKVKVEYPDLSTRVALSEAELDRGAPRALLLREGLPPHMLCCPPVHGPFPAGKRPGHAAGLLPDLPVRIPAVDAAVPGGVFAAVGAAGAGDVGPGGPLLKICPDAAGGSPAAFSFYPSLQNFAFFFSFLPKMWNLPKF